LASRSVVWTADVVVIPVHDLLDSAASASNQLEVGGARTSPLPAWSMNRLAGIGPVLNDLPAGLARPSIRARTAGKSPKSRRRSAAAPFAYWRSIGEVGTVFLRGVDDVKTSSPRINRQSIF